MDNQSAPAGPTTLAVPDRYVGLWQRVGIWRKDGSSDLTTRVWWFQSPHFHIDLRIPADRPHCAEPSAMAAMTAAERTRFAGQLAFAGTTVVDGDQCVWHPEIAFPAVSDETDVGRIRFDTPDQLHESALDERYEEDWIRLADGPVVGMRLHATTRTTGQACRGLAYVLLGAGWLAWAHGEPAARFDDTAPVSEAGWSEFTIARKRDDGQWQIVASNKPWREGECFSTDISSLQTLIDDVPILSSRPSDVTWHISTISPPIQA